MPPPTEKLLQELNPGEHFTGFVAIRVLHVRQKRDGSPYLALEFSDRSGRMSGNVWDNVEEFKKVLKVGQVVKLHGSITTYQDKKQITIEKLRPARPEDPVDKTRLIQTSQRSQDEMRRHLRRLIEGVENADIRSFLRRFFDDPEISEKYFDAPAGKLWHHAYLGGLAEHSLNMAEILLKVSEFYPNANRDLLVTGALLHDIGKIYEYQWDVSIDFSDRGRLIGHIVIGQELLNLHRQKDPEMPEEIWNQIIHMVLSHQGKYEHKTPILPATLEAVLLYCADLMDSKANAFNRIIQRSREQGDRWSEYIKLADTFLFAGDEEPQKGEGSQEDTLF
ncbi:hypothetical protein CEE37_04560 [candidate division LCP-89 bacterium B3_LCP]|uniref:HD/PDEase domain-containing protein n=1 Tax=candidate division LCP-89 bacterium B3_LCP TaxID=2012998 RepID=A0A532V3T1_UNCL8|nr:MAG: hypothetical protein CEE37_04560 [candidate division LCP-89 bacterium B3_LCP]